MIDTHEVVRLYVEQHKSIRSVAATMQIGASSVRWHLARAGVQRRSISEAKQGQKPAPHTVLASVRARRKHVDPNRPEIGYKVRPGGYVSIYDGRGGYEPEHRRQAGAAKGAAGVVHHINGNTSDNRPENLCRMSISEHMKLHEPSRQRDERGRFA